MTILNHSKVSELVTISAKKKKKKKPLGSGVRKERVVCFAGVWGFLK